MEHKKDLEAIIDGPLEADYKYIHIHKIYINIYPMNMEGPVFIFLGWAWVYWSIVLITKEMKLFKSKWL